MNAIINETQLWYSDIYDKTIIFKSKSKHIFSKLQKHKIQYGTVVKEYEFIKPEIDEVNYVLNDKIKDFSNKYFCSFEYK